MDRDRTIFNAPKKQINYLLIKNQVARLVRFIINAIAIEKNTFNSVTQLAK